MRTLSSQEDQVHILERIRSVGTDDKALWGVMSAQEMLRHLRGAFQIAMGSVHAEPVSVALPQATMKKMALWSDAPWRKGMPTLKELERGAPTMHTSVLEEDRGQLLDATTEFLKPGAQRADHPLFGEMSYEDWMRWGFLHCDHHLRQFGR